VRRSQQPLAIVHARLGALSVVEDMRVGGRAGLLVLVLVLVRVLVRVRVLVLVLVLVRLL
jgi:hypothetical protein